MAPLLEVSRMSFSRRPIDVALMVAVVGLTLATGYIHFWVGGTLLLLNAAGYAGLAGMVVVSALVYRRALPLVLAALAGYAAVTIIGWLIMGPYFDVAYLAKVIEMALIGAIAVFVLRSRAAMRESIRWARSLLGSGLAMVTRRRPAAAPSRGEE
jgi:hypothetical protein